jgi:hypothetical protein
MCMIPLMHTIAGAQRSRDPQAQLDVGQEGVQATLTLQAAALGEQR